MTAIIAACAALLAATPCPTLADIVIDLGRGPVTVHVPSTYDPDVPAPLVFLLHGYTANGAGQEFYFQLLPLADEYGFLYLYPDGTEDQVGNRFWKATDACCNFFGSEIDDSGYLLALADEIENRLNVDSGRVYFVGHSNGGFMSYRMACDHPDRIAAVASLAGATFDDPADCSAASPVHVLQIHGTADEVIRYNGGSISGQSYPGAVETVEQWAMFGGCAESEALTLPSLDLDTGIPGRETNVRRYASDCRPGSSGELWSISGGSHVPWLSSDFGRLVIEYLIAHPKSQPTAVEAEWIAAPSSAGPMLLSAAPNPFNPRTQLRYRLSETSRVSLTVYDAAGRLVRTLVSGERQTAGDHRMIWDGRTNNGQRLASGVYLLKLETGTRATSRKVVSSADRTRGCCAKQLPARSTRTWLSTVT